MRKLLVLIYITCVVGLLNYWTSPTLSDDIIYSFVFQYDDPMVEPFERISNIFDVIRSQIIHYQIVNGRSVVHTLVQFFINLTSPLTLKVLNTLMFLILIILTTLYTTEKKGLYNTNALIIFGFIFLCISGFQNGFLWRVGTFNYLWVMTITIAFLWLIRKYIHQKLQVKHVLLLPPAFLAGWTHEAIAVPLSITFIIYMLLHRKKVFQQTRNYLFLSYIAGMCMIISSPAFSQRVNSDNLPINMLLIQALVNLLINIRISWILVLTIVVISIHQKSVYKEIIRCHGWLLLFWILTVVLVLASGTTVERVALHADFVALIILIKLWQGMFLYKHRQAIIVTILILTLAVFLPALKVNMMNNENCQYNISQIKLPEEKIVKVRQLPVLMPQLLKLVSKRYMMAHIEYNNLSYFTTFDENSDNAQCMAHYYGKHSILMLPEDVVDNIRNNKYTYRYAVLDEHKDLIICHLPHKHPKVRRVLFLLGKENSLKFYQRSYPSCSFELDETKYKTIQIDGNNYLVMMRPPLKIFKRVEKIVIS